MIYKKKIKQTVEIFPNCQIKLCMFDVNIYSNNKCSLFSDQTYMLLRLSSFYADLCNDFMYMILCTYSASCKCVFFEDYKLPSKYLLTIYVVWLLSHWYIHNISHIYIRKLKTNMTDSNLKH